MNSLKVWFKNHSELAHTLVGGWSVATILFASDPAFKNYIWKIFTALPKGVHEFIAGIIVPALIYYQTQKRTTVKAEVAQGYEGTAEATAVVVEKASDK